MTPVPKEQDDIPPMPEIEDVDAIPLQPLSPTVEPRRSARLGGRQADFRVANQWFGPNALILYLASEVAIIEAISSSGSMPRSVYEALSGSDADRWKEAMKREIVNIELKDTWEETVLPHGRKAIESR